MHVGKLMARLNAKNVRFDVGSGGLPDLTPQDIAAALGMVPSGLGRELLCRLWWPDGSLLTARELSRILQQTIRAEWASRESALLDGLLAVASHTGGESLRQAQRKYADAHANRWPKYLVNADTGEVNKVYENMARCVVFEIVEPKHCPTCTGRGHVKSDTGPKRCERCEGGGVVSYGNTRRARHLGVIESAYRQRWDKPYTWLLEYATDHLREATYAMERAAA